VPDFLATLIEDCDVTDRFCLATAGAAADVGHARGTTVRVSDLGHLRPGWLTLEQNAMTGLAS